MMFLGKGIIFLILLISRLISEFDFWNIASNVYSIGFKNFCFGL